MYVDAERDPEGWVVRLFDQSGKQASKIVYRLSYESAADEMIGELSVDMIEDLMHEMRRQVSARANEFLTQPMKRNQANDD